MELDPLEVAAGYVARHDYGLDRGPKPVLSFHPLTVWEDWIDIEPEHAWPVFVEIVRLRPADDGVLEQLSYRLKFLLERHWDSFHDRVRTLVAGNPRLTRIVPREVLEKSHYEPRYRSLPELADVWITNCQACLAHDVRRIIDNDPARALLLALEIIRRAPLYGFTSYDAMDPLRDLLRSHGAAVIDEVEAAAASSIAIRRVLWRMRPHQGNPPGKYDIATPIWERVLIAAGDTTDYNTDDPPGERTPLPDDLEGVAAAWFVYEETFWAWEEVNDIVDSDAERGWEMVVCLVEGTADADVLSAVGAGPLEDLLKKHGAVVVDRVEVHARRDTDFREALRGVWLSLDDMPADLADRFYWASGGVAQILERHGEPWRGDAT